MGKGAGSQVVQYVLVEVPAAAEPETGEHLFKRLMALKTDMLAVSREFYPLGVAGWERGVEALADKCFHDEDHRLLTTGWRGTGPRAYAVVVRWGELLYLIHQFDAVYLTEASSRPPYRLGEG